MNWNQRSINELEISLTGKILLRDTPRYDAAVKLFSAVDIRPRMICICMTREDVQAAVLLAVRMKLSLSVRGGGHDWQGRSLVDDGLVIDLSHMKGVEINSEEKIAEIEGGVTGTELLDFADKHGFTAVVGTSGKVGMAGFMSGGGYGLTSPAHGLGVDNLISAEVVLADGRIVAASKDENENLFWALRGGGGNFGVITSMRVKLYENKMLLSGLFIFPLTEAETVLRGYANIMAAAPESLSITAAVTSPQGGNTVVLLAPHWNGLPEEGTERLGAIRQLGSPKVSQTGEVSLKNLVASFDQLMVSGRHTYVKTISISTLNAYVIAEIVDAMKIKTSAHSAVSFLHLHGKPVSIALPETAFGLRDSHFVIRIAAEWEPSDSGNVDLHKKWADDLFHAITPFALPGGYPNLLGSEDHEQITYAYGSNLSRLKTLKKMYDPRGVFSAQPLER